MDGTAASDPVKRLGGTTRDPEAGGLAKTAHLVGPATSAHVFDNLIQILQDPPSDRPALTSLGIDGSRTMSTFGELLDRAHVFAVYLRNRGLRLGDPVALVLPSTHAFVEAFFGVLVGGGVPVPLQPSRPFSDVHAHLERLGGILSDCGARLLITSELQRDTVVKAGRQSGATFEVLDWAGIQKERAESPCPEALDPESLALIQYTSGTTSNPRGAALTHRAILHNVAGITQALRLGPEDGIVTWLPLHHDMGLIGGLLCALASRCSLVVMRPESFILNPTGWLEEMALQRSTIITAPNFGYQFCVGRVAESGKQGLDLSDVRAAMCGAEPVDPNTLEAFAAAFEMTGFRKDSFLPVYGLAENCLAATFPRLEAPVVVQNLDRSSLDKDRLAKPAERGDQTAHLSVSVGLPLAGQEVAISSDGQFALCGQLGEVIIRSPSLMNGYFGRLDDVSHPIRDGWFYTGDLGYISEGQLFITGRLKEVVIRRGCNIFPHEVEWAARRAPGVSQVVAFGVPNPLTGTEDLVLLFETREASEAAQKQIAKAITHEVSIAVGVRPDRVIAADPRTIPKTPSGKPQRARCRDLPQVTGDVREEPC